MSEAGGAVPVLLTRAVVHPCHCDHLGHMNTRHYAALFDDAIFLVWSVLGVSHARMRTEHGLVTVTVEMTTAFRAEARVGDLVAVTGALLRLGTKSAKLRLEMSNCETGTVLSTCDVVEVFVRADDHASAVIPEAIRQGLSGRLPTEGGEAASR